MNKRDKIIGARIPKEIDFAIKTLLKKEENKHRTYSDIVNIALEKYIHDNDNTLNGDYAPPSSGGKKPKKIR